MKPNPLGLPANTDSTWAPKELDVNIYPKWQFNLLLLNRHSVYCDCFESPLNVNILILYESPINYKLCFPLPLCHAFITFVKYKQLHCWFSIDCIVLWYLWRFCLNVNIILTIFLSSTIIQTVITISTIWMKRYFYVWIYVWTVDQYVLIYLF